MENDMSYRSFHNLSLVIPDSVGVISPAYEVLKEREWAMIGSMRDHYANIFSAVEEGGHGRDWCHSEGFVKDVIESSKEFPEYTFLIEIEGQRHLDFTKIYVKNGKSFRTEAKITFDEYDESKLKYPHEVSQAG